MVDHLTPYNLGLYHGRRVREVGTEKIYLIENYKVRHIVHPTVYNALFRDWDDIQDVQFDGVSEWYPINYGTGLTRFSYPTNPNVHLTAIYWIDDIGGYTKRWINNEQTMDHFHFIKEDLPIACGYFF
ncbi:hypothetical protein [Paenibacillus alvei]|uniref:Uncharacterized protein n=1 Tax=Paenibacillus alvei TaxID=44250 RepID=A0AAP7DLD5_PAEAL|nr:hypothetical protein [Paenibacillus alvei]NOJ73614.1 hypothetical protein [Paenibacillus alvei]